MRCVAWPLSKSRWLSPTLFCALHLMSLCAVMKFYTTKIQPKTSKPEDASRKQAGHINARHSSSGNRANWRTRDQREKAKHNSTSELEARSLDYLMPLQFESFFVSAFFFFFFGHTTAACGILVPQLGLQPTPAAGGSNHWIAWEFP